MRRSAKKKRTAKKKTDGRRKIEATESNLQIEEEGVCEAAVTARRRVQFNEDVRAVCFGRTQGSDGVPTSGGASLGMKLAKSSEQVVKLDDSIRAKLEIVGAADRRRLLREAGVNVSNAEGHELEKIRRSRQSSVSCLCVGVCLEETCECLANGVMCLDVSASGRCEPCSCDADSCRNLRDTLDDDNVKHKRAVKLARVVTQS